VPQLDELREVRVSGQVRRFLRRFGRELWYLLGILREFDSDTRETSSQWSPVTASPPLRLVRASSKVTPN